MSFEHAPVSKGLMIGCGLTSILFGIFDIKHYLHLQLVPHISRQHQYWRLFAHHLAFSNSSDLLVAELILYNVGVQIERQFGSVKYASFALVTTLVSTIMEFISLLLFHRFGLNYISSGPSTVIFSVLYQYSRIVPSAYQFRIFGVPLSNKSFIYVLALQLAISRMPGSLAVALIGIFAGQMYRSDLASLKSYRIPMSVAHFSARFLLPLVGSTRPPRRSNRALPDETSPSNTNHAPSSHDDELISTPRPAGVSTAPGTSTDRTEAQTGTGTSVVREWVNELTGVSDRAGVRVPPEAEISQLMVMFPDVQREVVVVALQRSPNIEGAVETLLSSQ